MSSTYAEPLDRLDAVLDELAAVGPEFRSVAERQEFLVRVARVTLDLHTLLTGVGVATTSTGDRVTAEQARRLACQARIIPVVLGTQGEVLDLGRSARLSPRRSARRWPSVTRSAPPAGCSVPAAWCEAHHARQPWASGGRTNLADGRLLCGFHHHRARDPAWQTHHHPNGSTTFHRRT